jgi:hypothetical protein
MSYDGAGFSTGSESSPDGACQARDSIAPPADGTRVRYFGDYDLPRIPGEGGMEIEFEARQCSLDRIVAVKITRAGRFVGKETCMAWAPLLYALLTGLAPFWGESVAETLLQVREDAPEPIRSAIARSLIEPLDAEGDAKVELAPLGVDAQRDLVGDGSESLGLRFVEEATREPTTTRQLFFFTGWWR